MLNTLANHGYLPRNGRDIAMPELVTAFQTGVNLAEAATRLVGAKALTASTTGNKETFNLDDVNKHGIIEHDASLSRADTFLGDNHRFNATIWAQTSSHFTAPLIDIPTAAAARKARLAAAKAENPQFAMTAADLQASAIETALYLAVMANGTMANGAKITGVRKFVDVLFKEERLPVKEGWTRPAVELSAASLLQLAQLISAA